MSLKQKALSGIFWSSIERFSVQGIQFAFGILLARILAPSDYGLTGMLTIFFAVSQSFIDSGFSNALIRKQNRTETDFSTVFYFNIAVGLLFYFMLFFASPYIAAFYDAPILENLTRVVALGILVNSLSIVPRAKFTINVDFKTQTKASLLSVIISGIVGILMAYRGFGVWALAVQSVVGSSIGMVAIWLYSRWIPKRIFSVSSFKDMFSYGSKLLLSGLMDTVYTNMCSLIIGKKFSKNDLGYYVRADSFTQYPSSNITGILQRVTFPILSSIQDDDKKLKETYRRFLRLSAFVIFPLMTGLLAIASPLIKLVLTEKWSGVILLLQILCLSRMWYPIHAINLNLLQVKGRSDLFLRLEIIKKIVGVTILVITIPLGVAAMCAGMIASSIIALIVNTYYTGKLIDTGFFRQMKDLTPILFNSLFMCLAVWSLTKIIHSHSVCLISGLALGAGCYLGTAYLAKSPELREIKIITEPYIKIAVSCIKNIKRK
ncbi:MAG: lipopolysaccharide biosynthesis protein [Prevotellaceae bacterium]|jgi:O-antigen/teichoic acid export membrane protein|nr:lipopolysaccharide biosynthesis protein [Prevotellaceae bacterium]